MVSPKLKVYAMVAGIFVLGAGAGGAAGYAVASKRVAELVGDDRPDAFNARRFEALSSELDLTREQRRQVRAIMERHRAENRDMTRAMFEQCGGDLQGLRARVDSEIRAVLSPPQQQRFGELMEQRGRRFPLGSRLHKGGGPRD
jgi:Spy/CpxP family protein refolding chaperone